jgi:hypothetical protein
MFPNLKCLTIRTISLISFSKATGFISIYILIQNNKKILKNLLDDTPALLSQNPFGTRIFHIHADSIRSGNHNYMGNISNVLKIPTKAKYVGKDGTIHSTERVAMPPRRFVSLPDFSALTGP